MPGKFSYTKGMRRGGEKDARSRFVSQEAVERYANMHGEEAATARFGGSGGNEEEAIAQAAAGALNSALGNEQKQEEAMAKKMAQQNKAQAKNMERMAESVGQSPPPSASQYFNNSGADEAAERQQERLEKQQQEQAQEAELRSEIDEEKRAKIEKLKQQRDAKIEAYRNGSKKPPFLGFFMNNISLYIMGAVDFALGWIPFVGDFISFGISAFIWFIPCLILFDLMTYIKILGFLFVDLFIGLIPGVGDLADLAPEILLAKWGPPAQLRKSWESKLPGVLERIRQDYDRKIAIVQADEKSKLDKRLARIRGHFSGLAAENQKIVFLLAFIGIIVLGPFGVGAFSETQILSSLPVVGVIILLLLLGTKLGMLEQKEMFGLILFMALNVLLSVMLKANDFLSSIFKDNTVIVMILFAVFSLLFVLKTMDLVNTKTIIIIMVLLILGLSSFNMIGYFSGNQFQADKEQTVAQREASWEDANLLEKLQLWVAEQKLKGSGEYLPDGETESTYEFMGVRMENPDPFKDIFYSTEPVQIDIDYAANSYEPISISTSCRTGTYMGEIQPSYPVEATASFFPRVSCIFEKLPVGTHNVAVKGVYNYRSTVRLPIQIISTDFETILLAHKKDAGTTLDLQEFLEESKAITSAGPIQIGVSNTKEMGANVLRMPIAMDEDSIISQGQDNRVHRLKFQLQLSHDDENGKQKIERVTKAQFNMPEGLAISNCNFAPDFDLQPLTEDGRWIYTVIDNFNKWEIFTTIECDVGVDKQYADVFFPEGVDWSKSTMLFTVDYDYSIQKSAIVRVEA